MSMLQRVVILFIMLSLMSGGIEHEEQEDLMNLMLQSNNLFFDFNNEKQKKLCDLRKSF